MAQLDDPVAEVDLHPILERVGRAGQAGDRVGSGEEAWHAARLAGPVLQAALLDPFRGLRMGNDATRTERGCPQHADCVVVREDEVAERKIGQRPDDVDPTLRHDGGGTRLDSQHRIGPDDAADVRVTLRGVGVDARCELLHGGGLLGQVGRGCEGPAAHAADDRPMTLRAQAGSSTTCARIIPGTARNPVSTLAAIA